MKYILVTGGVISGIGKGIVASSVGTLLKAYGWNVTCIKIDPYLNIDAGTFSPYEHGEVYVLDDGGEVDLDLGNYERFLDITLTKDNNITTGKIYQKIIEKERRGDYLGKTVQVVPHVTDAIMEWVVKVAHVPVDEIGQVPEVCIVELGGTIGDIESMPFVEAFRQMLFRVGCKNFCCLHVSLVPQLTTVGEPKTKPTQASVRELRAAGLHPDLLICRCSSLLPASVITKISLFSQVPVERVITVVDTKDLYEVPILLNDQNVCNIILEHFNLNHKPSLDYPILGKWKALTRRLDHAREVIRVAIVGKYTKLNDAYLSLFKALRHASIYVNRKLDIQLVCASDLEESTRFSSPDAFHQAWLSLSNCQCVVVPGGFGVRGIEGKLEAIKFCRERNIPFLGLCLGLQCAVIEFARNVLGWKDANSSEFDSYTENSVIIDMPEHNPGIMGGTMRLGRRRTFLYLSDTAKAYLQRTYSKENDRADTNVTRSAPLVSADGDSYQPEAYCYSSVIHKLINAPYFDARHRHRYEVNPQFVDRLEDAGFLIVGRDADSGNRMEVIELLRPVTDTQESNLKDVNPNKTTCRRHPFFVATQFHPEYTSRPARPSIFFVGLLLAATGRLNSYLHSPFRLSPTHLMLNELDETTDTVNSECVETSSDKIVRQTSVQENVEKLITNLAQSSI